MTWKYWQQKFDNALDLAFALSVPLPPLFVTGNQIFSANSKRSFSRHIDGCPKRIGRVTKYFFLV
jgi:hypothetical protein